MYKYRFSILMFSTGMIDTEYFKKTAQTAHPINSATLKDRILYKKRPKKYFKNSSVYGMGSLGSIFSLL